MSTDEIKVFWQPGCTSCLRTKEFLTRHNVPFVSVNVIEDGFEGLTRFGLRQVPIVVRGDAWVNGQVLADVARLAGISLKAKIELAAPELHERLVAILEAALRYLDQLPEARFGETLPGRPRSYGDLVFHIFNIADAFLEHERGIPLEYEAYNRTAAPGQDDKAALRAYGQRMLADIQGWWAGDGARTDFAAEAHVYYGRQTLRDYLERTTWHCGQHARQLIMVLGMLGIAPHGVLGPEAFADLPMPENVWDD